MRVGWVPGESASLGFPLGLSSGQYSKPHLDSNSESLGHRKVEDSGRQVGRTGYSAHLVFLQSV